MKELQAAADKEAEAAEAAAHKAAGHKELSAGNSAGDSGELQVVTHRDGAL